MKMTKLAALLMALSLSGCAAKIGQNDGINAGMQQAYDLSVEAEAYTQQLLESMLAEQGITEYQIEQTSGGFITDDPPVFITGYRYTHDGKEAVYGYKLSLNEDGKTFTVLEESEEAGEFVVGHAQ